MLATTNFRRHFLCFVSFFRKKRETFYFDHCRPPLQVAVERDAVNTNGQTPPSDYNKCHCFSVKEESNGWFLKERDCEDELHSLCELSMFKTSKSFCFRKF